MFRAKPKRWPGNKQPRVNRSHPLASSLLWGLFPYGDSVYSIDSTAQALPAQMNGSVRITTDPVFADPVFTGVPVVENPVAASGTDGVNIPVADARLRLGSDWPDTFWIALRYIAYGGQTSQFRRILDCSSGGSGAGGWSIYLNSILGSQPTFRRNGESAEVAIAPELSLREVWYDLFVHASSKTLAQEAFMRLSQGSAPSVFNRVGEFATQAAGLPNIGLLNSSASWSQAHAMSGSIAYAAAFQIPEGENLGDAIAALWEDFRLDPYALIAPTQFYFVQLTAPSAITPQNLTLGWSVEDVTVTGAETQLDVDDLTLGWSVADATLTQEETSLTVDDVTLQWAVDAVNVTAANVIAPENLELGWALANADVGTDIIEPEAILYGWGIQNVTLVQEEQPLTPDALTLGWSLDNAQVIGAGVVAPEDMALGWSLDDASLVIAEQSLTPAFVALTWQVTNVTVQQFEQQLDVDSLSFGWTLDDVILPVDAITPAALSLQWSLGFAQVFEAMPEEAVQLVRVVRPESVDVKVFSSTRGVKK